MRKTIITDNYYLTENRKHRNTKEGKKNKTYR